MTTLRLILGDQLNPQHSWFSKYDKDVIYVLMEVRQETDYVRHHGQKILAIFAAMRDFSRQLEDAGHCVRYLAIDDPANLQSLPANLDALIVQYQAEAFEYQAPDEWRLDQQLADYVQQLATKPYVSSAAYIDRMSDYCKGCNYDKKDRLGEKACPFNALYWDFFARNSARLASNPRLSIVYRQLAKMPPDVLRSTQEKAAKLRLDLANL